jgi:predicted esterase
VRVQSDTELVSYQGWTLRTRAAAQRPARILLLIHGWTGDENSMWVFVRNLAPTYWIVAPRAPYATHPAVTPGGIRWERKRPPLMIWLRRRSVAVFDR